MTTERKRMWGWLLYDWASQPYSTLLLTFIFAPYFTSAVVGDGVAGQSMWALMVAVVGLTLAVLGPILGAVADTTGVRRPWIVVFSVLYIIGSFGLWWAVPGMDNVTWILILFGIGLLGMELSLVFVNSMIPDIVGREETGKLSGNGFAIGYVGGLVLLFIMLLLLAENEEGKTLLGNPPIFGLDPETREGTRSVGPITAAWFVVFMIPFFMWIKEPKPDVKKPGALGIALSELVTTIKNLPNNISLGSYLLSSMFYRDALFSTYTFGGIYASGVLGWSVPQIGIFGIVAGLTAAIFTWLGGYADKAFGPKRVIRFNIYVLIVVVILIVGTSRTTFFGAVLAEGSTFPDTLLYVCGAVLGAAGGILQAASRTMVIYQANEDRLTEAFGLYALAGKATAWLAPLMIFVFTEITQNQRLGFAPVIVLFGIALCLLFWVDDKRS